MAAKTVFNSCDLLRHIYSFGDPGHREVMRDLAIELQVKPYDFVYEFLSHKMIMTQEEQDSYSMVGYLEGVSHARLLKILTRYKRCFCCRRHNIQKPMFHEGQLVTFTGVVHEVNQEGDCKCICRHYSRAIMMALFNS